MKKWLYLAAALTAVGILSRLPHPAKDIAKLKPVRAVYLYMELEKLHIETDTGDSGSGRNSALCAISSSSSCKRFTVRSASSGRSFCYGKRFYGKRRLRLL